MTAKAVKEDDKKEKRIDASSKVHCIVLKDRMKIRYFFIDGGLAQLGERVLCKHEVIGSSPIFSTITAGSSAG